MPKENNKMQVDIENLIKQNVNDLSAIKELYRKLQDMENKILQIKYIDSNLANKLKKDYENLKKDYESLKKVISEDYESLKCVILDENIQAKLSNDINVINSHLDTIANVELPKLDNKRYKITRSTKKIFDNATVVNINNTGKQAEICGFRKESDLSTYADRDSAIMYVDGTLPSCKILEVINFTVDSVKVLGDTSSIEDGMIIDCMNQSDLNPFNQTTKFSGFVTEVIGQTIKVNGWYQLGNSASGQVPNKDRIIINPVTKLWTMNNNLFLNADSFGWGGVIAEYGMYNRKSVATGNENYRLSGIDLINYDGVCEYGYSIRNSNTKETTKTKIGFKADKTVNSFRSSNAKNAGFISDNDNIGFSSNNNNIGFKSNEVDNKIAFQNINGRFKVNGFGTINNLLLKMKVYGSNSTITPYDAFLHIVGSGTHTLPSPSNFPYAYIKILAQTDVTIEGAMFTNTGDITTKSLGAWRTLELYSDGAKWYVIF